VGFTSGEIVDNDWVQVTTHDAHAWPELWFPKAGWVPFEPTPRADGTVTLPSYTTPAGRVPADEQGQTARPPTLGPTGPTNPAARAAAPAARAPPPARAGAAARAGRQRRPAGRGRHQPELAGAPAGPGGPGPDAAHRP